MSDQEPNSGMLIQSIYQEVDENWASAGWSTAANAPVIWTENGDHEAPCYNMILEAPTPLSGESSGTKIEMQTRETNKLVKTKEEPKTSDKRKMATTSTSPTAGRKLYQRLRRQKINEKMKALQELIPNCNKRDNLSTLDDAIKYIENLQCQLHLMMIIGGVSSMLNSQMMSNTQQSFEIPYLASFLQATARMKYEIETRRFSASDFSTMSQFGLRNPYLLSSSGLMPSTAVATTTANSIQNQEINNLSELLNLTCSSSYTHSSGFQSPTSEEARDGSSSKNELCPLIHDHEKSCSGRKKSSTRVLPSQIIPSHVTN